MMPITKPAVAIPRPPSAPPELSIACLALWPCQMANGAQSPQTVSPTIPRIRAGTAPGAFGAWLGACW